MKARALVAWNVRRIRVQNRIPQEQLAYDTGIDRSYMSELERREANPTIDLLERLTKTLGVHISELFVQPPKGALRPKPLKAGRKAKASPKKRP